MRYRVKYPESKISKKDYVIKTIEEYNELAINIKKNKGDWLDRILYLICHYYDQEPVGGHLHIVLDDDNINDISIAFCKGGALEARDYEAVDIASLMLLMTMKQRKKLLKELENYEPKEEYYIYE